MEWEEREGKVVLKKPKVRSKFWRKLLLPLFFGNRPFYYIHLDEIGSFVIRLCDGKHSLIDIEKALQLRFGPMEDLERRLGLFMAQLLKADLIEIKEVKQR